MLRHCLPFLALLALAPVLAATNGCDRESADDEGRKKKTPQIPEETTPADPTTSAGEGSEQGDDSPTEESQDDGDDQESEQSGKEDCVRTQGYWKNHNTKTTHGGAQNKKPWPVPEDTLLCGQTWYDILQTPPSGGEAWYILAHQWIAASLNVASGAVPSADVQAALDTGKALLETCAISAADRPLAIETSGLLDRFNNGNTEHECPDDGDDDDDDDDDDDTTTTDITTDCGDETNIPPGLQDDDDCGEETDTTVPPV